LPNSGLGQRCPALPGLLCLIVVIPLSAQPVARLDLAASSRYVWHGLSRAAGLVLQPSLAVGYQLRGFSLASGLARHYELDGVSPGELSELRNSGGHLGEDDFWVQADVVLGSVRLRSGIVRYVFRAASPPQGGVGPLGNTTEAYFAAGVTSTYLNPSVEAWWDVARVRGGFLRVSASTPAVGWPIEPFVFLSLGGEIGVNLGQAADPTRPADLANFSRRGLTHAGLALDLLFRVSRWPGLGSANLNLGLNSQLNLDDATRYDGSGRSQKVILWLSAGITLLLGGEARTQR
jgi:hypothetical protein